MAKRKIKRKSKKFSSLLIVVVTLTISFYLHQFIGNREISNIEQLIVQGNETIHKVVDKHKNAIETLQSKETLSEESLELARHKDLDTRVVSRNGYMLSFNDKWLIPNWVAWRLAPERLKGNVKRTDDFLEDMNLPKELRVQHRDYSRSGYDRGHMVPAADMKWDEMAMQESFYMSNICPQSPNLNKGDWKELEEQCREWTKIHNTTLYIACGPIVKSGVNHKVIGKNNKVTVPDGFFKVVMKLGKYPAAVGFLFPNDNCDAPLVKYAVSVDSVENVTGIDFFYLLPEEKEKQMEAINGINEF